MDTLKNPTELIAAAEAETDAGSRNQFLQEAIDLLSQKPAESADALYALGYAWYLLPTGTGGRQERISANLEEALRKDPGHAYARLYLAHHNFDDGNFAKALPLLDSLSPTAFEERGQAWRDVKVAELVVCCLIELKATERLGLAIQILLERATSVEPDYLPLASELTGTLQKRL